MSGPTNIVSRALLVAAALTAAAVSAAAQMAPWEQALYDGAKKEKEFTVYTAHYDTETIADVCAAFEKKYPGVKCNFVRTTAQVAFQRLQQDMKANLAVASVFSSTDISHYPELKKEGVLVTYQPHNLAKMVDSLKQYNDKDNQYWVTAAALVVIAYNTSLVSEKDAPKKLDRPARSRSGRTRSRSATRRSAATSAPGRSQMRKLYGWQLLREAREEQAADRPLDQRHGDDAQREGALGRRRPGGDDAAQPRQGQSARRRLPRRTAPAHGLAETGIPKNAPAPNAGKLFVEFLLDKEAAEVQVKNHQLSVIKGIKPAPGAKPLEEIKVIRPTEEEIAKGIPEVKEQFRDTFGI